MVARQGQGTGILPPITGNTSEPAPMEGSSLVLIWVIVVEEE